MNIVPLLLFFVVVVWLSRLVRWFCFCRTLDGKFCCKASCMEIYILAIKERPVKVDHKLSLWVAALCAIKKLRTWELVLTQSCVCPVYLDASFILPLASYRTYVPPAFLWGSIVSFSSSLLYIGTKLLGCLPWLFALSRTKHHLCSVIHLFYYSRHMS